jgi:hypothetical protein
MPHLTLSEIIFCPILQVHVKELIENGELGLVYCFFDPRNHRRDFRVFRNRRNSDMVSAGAVFSIPDSFYRIASLGPKGRERSITSQDRPDAIHYFLFHAWLHKHFKIRTPKSFTDSTKLPTGLSKRLSKDVFPIPHRRI